jgi:glutamate N-acetyltransferase/amino-acid N-acetyltransferase
MRLPSGFLASGVYAGVRKKKRPDLALIVAPGGVPAAAVFTRNRFVAAPVVLSKAALKASGGRVSAVVVNAGCANAVTGDEGMAAARRVRKRAAELAGCPENEVFLASTGVIGVVLPDALVTKALPGSFARLSASGVEAASEAILTTDVGPKVARASFVRDGRRVRLVGFAKGAGMIAPDMATMLAFVLTDAPAGPGFLKGALKRACDASFNAVTVDGDTSTNDTVLLAASGKAGGAPMASLADEPAFLEALTAVCRELAWRIVRDGEGATRVMEISVTGARSDREARLAARTVANSPLVKTALSGGDPNWGRILAAVGRSGARFSASKVSLAAGRVVLVRDGQLAPYLEKDAAKVFSRELVPLKIDLGAGAGTALVLAADLGHDYVSLNADYRT